MKLRNCGIKAAKLSKNVTKSAKLHKTEAKTAKLFIRKFLIR